MTSIPKISDAKLNKLRKKIRPIARFVMGQNGMVPHREGFLHFLVSGHPRNTTFYFELVAGEKVKGLKPLKTITTHHSTGGFFFKPSEAEVLAQIPEKLIKVVVAYEIVGFDMERAREHGDSTATLQLYKK